VAVVGCGMIASTVHIPLLARNPNLRLAWLCDVQEEPLRRLAAQYDVQHVTTDYLDLLKDPTVDMVVLATTHTLRVEFIEQAARYGKPVYVEKPMAGTLPDIARILQVVRESGIPFCVGHNRRSAPAILEACAILERHRANPAITPWRLDRNSHLRPPMPEEGETMVLLRVNDDYLTWKPWSFAEGMLLCEMPHFLDLANLFIAREPRRVFAMGSTRLNFTILVEYDDGSIATLTDSGAGTLDYPKELVEITHRGAMIAIDHCLEIRTAGIEGEPFRRTFPSLDTRVKTDKAGIEYFYEAAQQTIAERLRTGDHEIFLGFPDKGHYAHFDRFAACIRGEGETPCDAESAAQATVLTLKALESCRLGMPVRVGPEELHPIVM
jgi:predicted dehydrogenase